MLSEQLYVVRADVLESLQTDASETALTLIPTTLKFTPLPLR